MKLSYILISGFVLSMFVPAAFAFQATPGRGDPAPCPVTWVNPSGTYSFGSLIQSFVSTKCAGTGNWILLNSGGVVTGPNSFTCPSAGCSNLVLLSTSSLAPGRYFYEATFNGVTHAFSFTVSDFFVTPQFIGGSVLAVLAPIIALAFYAMRKGSLRPSL
jgi:hypothetical protein